MAILLLLKRKHVVPFENEKFFQILQPSLKQALNLFYKITHVILLPDTHGGEAINATITLLHPSLSLNPTCSFTALEHPGHILENKMHIVPGW